MGVVGVRELNRAMFHNCRCDGTLLSKISRADIFAFTHYRIEQSEAVLPPRPKLRITLSLLFLIKW